MSPAIHASDTHVLADGLMFGESPRWHDGRLWFADFGAREIGAVDLEGHRELVARTEDMPMGIEFLADGRLVILAVDVETAGAGRPKSTAGTLAG